jgi:hypothetical protein
LEDPLTSGRWIRNSKKNKRSTYHSIRSNVAHFQKLPASEFRRQYLRTIIKHLRARGMTVKEAMNAAEGVLTFMQQQIYCGFPLNLGFMKIDPKVRRPMSRRWNLSKSEHPTTYLIGEHIVWGVKVSKHWQKKHKPKWSRAAHE